MQYFGEVFQILVENPIITEARVIVLEGPPNSGKSQFAEQLAAQIRSHAPLITDVFFTSIDGGISSSAERKRIECIVSGYETFKQGEACFHCEMRPMEINVRRLVLVMDYSFDMDMKLVDLLQNPNITLILTTQVSHADMDEMKVLNPSCYLFFNPCTHQCAVWKSGELVLEYEDEWYDSVERPRSPPPPPSSPSNECHKIENVKKDESPTLRILSGSELTKLRRKENSRMPAFHSVPASTELSRPSSYARVIERMDVSQKTGHFRNHHVRSMDTGILERFLERHLQHQGKAKINEMIAPLDKCWEDVWFSIDH